MVKKKSQPSDSLYMLYVLGKDQYLAGTEIDRTPMFVLVSDPAFISVSAEGTGYDTAPVMFIAPGVNFRIYLSGMVGDAQMPPGIIPWYQQYKKQRKEQAKQVPQ